MKYLIIGRNYSGYINFFIYDKDGRQFAYFGRQLVCAGQITFIKCIKVYYKMVEYTWLLELG